MPLLYRWRDVPRSDDAPEMTLPASNQIPCLERRPVSVSGSGMVNYYLQLFLPHTERQSVGIDEQFEHAVPRALDLARIRAAGSSGRAVFLSSSDSSESAGRHSSAGSHPQPGLHQWQN